MELNETNSKTPEEVAEATKKNLDEFGLKPVDKVTVKDPLTGETREITLDRSGTGENKLILALADPNLKRDQKDHVLSMYLWERGKESSSMLVDLMRYKGTHTKETRAFTSQMRFDFELFVSQFSKFIREQSRLIGVTIGLDIFKETEAYRSWLKQNRTLGKKDDYTYIDFFRSKPVEMGTEINRVEVALIEMAITSLEEGERLIYQIQNVTKARERDKGKGIYVGFDGRITTYDDPDFDEIVKADREREAELKKTEL